MRVFVAGASGAIGRRLVPQLIDAGHEVVGTYNSPSNVTDVEVTLIVMAPTPDAQTGLPRLTELHGRGHCLNQTQ